MIGNTYNNVGVLLYIGGHKFNTWIIPNVQSMYLSFDTYVWMGAKEDADSVHIHIDIGGCHVEYCDDGGFYTMRIE